MLHRPPNKSYYSPHVGNVFFVHKPTHEFYLAKFPSQYLVELLGNKDLGAPPQFLRKYRLKNSNYLEDLYLDFCNFPTVMQS